MNSNFTEPNKTTRLLADIRDDMDVYDSEGKHVGEVEYIYFGAAADEASEYGTGAATAPNPAVTDSILQDVVEAIFSPEDEVPEPIRKRLLSNGFIRIEADGIFASDRYVMPDQISHVSNKGVHLKVKRDELIKEL